MSNHPSYPSIPIGVDDYKKLIDNKSAYVDKTLLVKEFWQDGAEVALIPRPRRFGKTLNLSMLRYFFEKTDQDTSYLFEKTNIGDYPEYQALQGQFPVIFLTFKDIKANSWELAYKRFASIISEECKRLLPSFIIEKIDASDFDIFNRLKFKEAPEDELVRSIQFLSRLLYEQTGKKVIILIDEYDAPILYAYISGYYSEMIKFMRDLLSTALKSNSCLKKGLLTGITRISKEDIFSGLNRLAVRTVLNTQYSDKFGFTQEEVDQLLTQYELTDKKDEVKSWYDGYIFGNTNIYNPWSLLNCIENRGVFQTYWANTSNNDLIKDLIAKSNQAIKDDIELLLQGEILVDKKIDENVALRDIKKNNQGLWGLFLSTGYLTATSHTIIDEDYYYTLAIPNKEITKLYRQLVTRAIDETLQSGQITELFTALMKGDLYNLTTLLKEFVINSCSHYDLPENDLERSLHLFVLGLLAGLSNRYIIQSNRESGHGRYDIMLMPRNKQDPGILIEFKKAKDDKESTLTALAQEALEQIKIRDYAAQLRAFDYSDPIFTPHLTAAPPILCYGIAAYGKHLVVNMEKI